MALSDETLDFYELQWLCSCVSKVDHTNNNEQCWRRNGGLILRYNLLEQLREFVRVIACEDGNSSIPLFKLERLRESVDFWLGETPNCGVRLVVLRAVLARRRALVLKRDQDVHHAYHEAIDKAIEVTGVKESRDYSILFDALIKLNDDDKARSLFEANLAMRLARIKRDSEPNDGMTRKFSPHASIINKLQKKRVAGRKQEVLNARIALVEAKEKLDQVKKNPFVHSEYAVFVDDFIDLIDRVLLDYSPSRPDKVYRRYIDNLKHLLDNVVAIGQDQSVIIPLFGAPLNAQCDPFGYSCLCATENCVISICNVTASISYNNRVEIACSGCARRVSGDYRCEC